jgi:hypothetical protein
MALPMATQAPRCIGAYGGHVVWVQAIKAQPNQIYRHRMVSDWQLGGGDWMRRRSTPVEATTAEPLLVAAATVPPAECEP